MREIIPLKTTMSDILAREEGRDTENWARIPAFKGQCEQSSDLAF